MFQQDRVFLVRIDLLSFEDLKRKIGLEVGVSKWFTIDQERINKFADVTEDHQFIHVDPKKAAETPFGKTVAHGFLTLSLLSAMSYDAIPRIEGLKMGVNYGFNKIRFVTPVAAGSKVRAHFTLKSSEIEMSGELTNILDVSIEIDGSDRPALVAEWVSRQYF